MCGARSAKLRRCSVPFASAVTRERRHRPTPAEFSEYLRARREQKSLTLADISRITKVPTPSLQRLEDGEFDKLPAEVFVRGFLRSYAKCVGLDPEEVVRKYADTRQVEPEPEPVLLTEDTQGEMAGQAATSSESESIDIEVESPQRAESPTRARLHQTGQFVARQLFEDRSEGSRRGAVTLAVIILVIVATLTMSYLLRRPNSSGDGVTHREQVIDIRGEHQA